MFFNDAGIGKERAGIVAVTYSHNSARIGDAVDGFESGVVSAVNAAAAAAGLDAGQTVAEAVALMRRERADDGDRNDR